MTSIAERRERAETVRMGGFAPSGAGETMAGTDGRLMALELENLRLTRLVAELLLKNQVLRTELKGAV